MGFLSNIFNPSSFTPDYRDVILFNGYLPFRATGRFKGNLVEFEQFNNPTKVIFFNTNQTPQQYLEFHDKFELYRNKNLNDFTQSFVQMSEGLYYPTGRIFYNKKATLEELMKINNPYDVMYFGARFLDFTEDNFIIGKKCLEITLNPRK